MRLGIALNVMLLSACAGGNHPVEPGPAASYRVLFIGNSLTSSNDLPGTVAGLAASVGDTIAVEAVTRPDLAIIDHVNGSSDALDVVRRGGWDYVILQQGPTASKSVATRSFWRRSCSIRMFEPREAVPPS